MLQHYFRQSLRALSRDRLYTLLNLSGLAVGLAAALLVLLWVQDELTYDGFHRQGQNIYRILTNWNFGGARQWTAVTPAGLAPEAKANLPEVQDVARTWRIGNRTIQINATMIEAKDCVVADKSLFDMFDFPLVKTDGSAPLTHPNGILLTEKLARQCFADADPLGKTLRLDNKIELVVTGILKDLPDNSSIKFSCLLPWEPLAEKIAGNPRNFGWGNMSYASWFLLRPDADVRALEHKLSELVNKHRNETPENQFWYMAQPLRQVYLDSGFVQHAMNTGNRQTILIFGWIGFLILLIACINYVNLVTARATNRAREVGVRKSVGAARGQLFGQFMMESALLILGATALAALLAVGVLPAFNELSGKTFTPDQFLEPVVLRVIGATALSALLLAGIYPALLLIRFNPAGVLRGLTNLSRAGHSGLRKILATTQFIFSVTLTLCALVISCQMDYIRTKKLGYERAQVFSFQLPYQDPPTEPVVRELSARSDVAAVCFSDNSIIGIGSQNGGMEWEGKPEGKEMPVWQLTADNNFASFFDIRMKEGRWFLPERNGADSTSFIINEAAAKEMGFSGSALGKWVAFQDIRGSITGVVKDFNFSSLHDAVEPLIIWQYPGWGYTIYVKTKPGQEQEAVAAAEAVYKKYVPNKVFKYQFLDEAYELLYKSEMRSGKLFRLFAGLAILISCLGLFGLATFTTTQRAKEIGIRKVLGATVSSITGLLAKDFMQLVLLSIAIASPIAWYLMQRWLQDFSYRIDLHWWMFGATAVAALVVAGLTVGLQSAKAALTNPVKSLRAE